MVKSTRATRQKDMKDGRVIRKLRIWSLTRLDLVKRENGNMRHFDLGQVNFDWRGQWKNLFLFQLSQCNATYPSSDHTWDNKIFATRTNSEFANRQVLHIVFSIS